MAKLPAWREYENKRLQKQLGISAGEFQNLAQTASQENKTVVQYLAERDKKAQELKQKAAAQGLDVGAYIKQQNEKYKNQVAASKRQPTIVSDVFDPNEIFKQRQKFVSDYMNQQIDNALYNMKNEKDFAQNVLNAAKETADYTDAAERRVSGMGGGEGKGRQRGHPEVPPPPGTVTGKGREPATVTYTPKAGATITRITTREKEITPPRFVFTLEGTPFYTQEQRDQERAAVRQYYTQLYKNDPTTMNWIKSSLMSWASTGGSKLQDLMYEHFLTIGGQTEEELMTQEKPDVLSATGMYLFNLAAAGVTWIKDLNLVIWDDARTKQAAAQMAASYREQAASTTDESKRKHLLELATIQDGIASGASINAAHERWQVASEAVMRSWASLVSASKRPEGEAPVTASTQEAARLRVENERRQASQLSAQYEQQAHDLYLKAINAGSEQEMQAGVQQALDVKVEALKERRKADPFDSFGAATWVREPERYDAFLKDVAFIELQIGRPLNVAELRRVKDYHTNVWTELSFQMIFDVTNFTMIPGASAVIDTFKADVRALPVISDVLRGISKATKEAKVSLAATPVIGTLFRDTAGTIAGRIERAIGNNFARIALQYGSTDELLADIPKLGRAIKAGMSAPSASEMEKIFMALRGEMKGAEILDFATFKQLVDVSTVGRIDPETWDVLLEKAIQNSETPFMERAIREAATNKKTLTAVEAEQIGKAMAHDTKNMGLSLEEFATNFSQAYTDSRRVGNVLGSQFLDDTLFGQVQKYVKAFGENDLLNPKVLNKALVENAEGAEAAVIAWAHALGVKSPEWMKKLVTTGFDFVGVGLKAAGYVRDLWSTLVLSTPRWLITNFIDSSTRSMIYGGNPLEDLFTLAMSTQAHFIDDIGFSPLEFGQSLARSGLEFHDRIPVKLVYENWKPRFGIFSYWGEEAKRLASERLANVLEKKAMVGADLSTEVARSVWKRLDNESKWLSGKYAALWNGVKSPFTAAGIFAGGIADYNTAIEFTLRTRMFHREYTTLLAKLEPDFMTKGMDALSPANKALAARIWKAAEGNPAKITALTDSIIRGVKPEDRAAWSLMLPENWDDLLGKINPADKQVFTYHVRTNLNEFVETTLKKEGRMPSADEFGTFVEKMREEYRNVTQQHIAGALEYTKVNGSIGTAGEVAKQPKIGELGGSAPRSPQEAVVSSQEAIQSLGKKRLPFKAAKERTVDSFKTAIASYATVSEIGGDAISIYADGDTLIVQIGKELASKKPNEIYAALNKASIDMMAEYDRKFILNFKTFNSLDDYKLTLEKFLKDPTGVLNDSEEKFFTIAQQFRANPELQDLFAATTGKGADMKLNFESAYTKYLESKKFDVPAEMMFDYRTNRRVVEAAADKVRPVHPERRQAGIIKSVSTSRLYDTARDASPEIMDAVRKYNNTMDEIMGEWETYLREFGIGPKLKTRGRSAAWEEWELAIADAYKKEAAFQDELNSVIKTDPARAQEMMKDATANAPDRFLNRMGVDMTVDEQGHIIKATIEGRVYTTRGPYSPLVALEARFYNKPIGVAEDEILRTINSTLDMPLRQQLTLHLHEAMNLPPQQAEAMARILENHALAFQKWTGEPAENYLERLGFRKVERAFQVTPGAELFKKSAIGFDKETNKFIFYGINGGGLPDMVRSTSKMFYADLVYAAEKGNAEAKDMLTALQKYIESASREKFAVGEFAMSEHQAQVFSDIFLNYLHTGQLELWSAKKPMEKFKSWLADAFEGVKTTYAAQEIPDDIYRALDGMFIKKQLTPEKANKMAAHQLAKEYGLADASPEELLKMVNDTNESRAVRAEMKDWFGGGILKDKEGNPLPMYHGTTTDQPLEIPGNFTKPVNPQTDTVSFINSQGTTETTTVEEALARSQKFFSARETDNGFQNLYGKDLNVDEVRALEDEAYNINKSLGDAYGYVRNQTDLGMYGQGLYFSPSPEAASWYAGTKEGANVRKVAINIKKPYEVGPIGYGEIKTEEGKLLTTPAERQSYLLSKGYDGIVVKNGEGQVVEVIVFNKDNIRPFAAIQPRTKFGDIADVPIRELEDVLRKTTGEAKTSTFASELQQAWDVWKTRRDFTAFPDLPMESIDQMKAYLRHRIDTEPTLIDDAYEQLLYQVEQFQSDFLKAYNSTPDVYKASEQGVEIVKGNIDWQSAAFPTIKEYHMSDGVRTAYRNLSYSVNNQEAVDQALDGLKSWLKSDKWKAPIISEESAKQLRDWSVTASKAKADLIGTVLNGGDIGRHTYEGAINKVNRVMLDYNSRNGFDQIMKNFFPFWMFPSRSIPFWVQTISTHPEIIAAYAKLKRLSNAQRYQAGAVTSTGKPLPSLDGYIKLPGTDMWVNPLAPMSFKYVLAAAEVADDMYYGTINEDDDIPPGAWMAQKMLEGSPIFGFSVAPWIAWSMKEAFNIPDSSLMQLPLLPEIPLIPRWVIADHVNMSNKLVNHAMGSLYPEASFNDYLVERRVLQNALEIIDSPTATPSERNDALRNAREAIDKKGDNPLWQQTYRELGSENATKAQMSFFTGLYPKEFTDSMADLLALRDENNMLKSAMNNRFQAIVFDIPTDLDKAWQMYLNENATDEGQLYRLYGIIGWVKNEDGKIVRDPIERAKYLSQAIKEDENQRTFYEMRTRLQSELQDQLSKVAVGTPRDDEEFARIYDHYYQALDVIEKKYTFSNNTSYMTNKPMELIERDIRNDWFKALNSTRPTFIVGEKYQDYQARVTTWESKLPDIAKSLLPVFERRPGVSGVITMLRPDQRANMSKTLFGDLLSISNIDGLNEWRKSNDDILDAMNNAWEALYWNPYWQGPGSIITQSGDPSRYAERDLADFDFAKNHPPPTEQQMYQWIVQNYGPNRFTLEDVRKWMNYGSTDVLSIDERMLKSKGEEYMARQEIYDLIAWISPSKNSKVMAVLNKELVDIGAPDNLLEDWMSNDNGQTMFGDDVVKLKDIADKIRQAYANLHIPPPDHERLVQYAKVEDSNNQFKLLVEDKLNMEYDRIINIQASYYDAVNVDDAAGGRSKRNRNLWIKENREEYKDLQTYWNMRKTYAKIDKLWGTYYMWAGGAPEEFQTVEQIVRNPAAVRQATPTTTTSSQAPGLSTLTLPAGMREVIGINATNNIMKAISGERSLASYDRNYLQKVAQLHPNWKTFIDRVLALP